MLKKFKKLIRRWLYGDHEIIRMEIKSALSPTFTQNTVAKSYLTPSTPRYDYTAVIEPAVDVATDMIIIMDNLANTQPPVYDDLRIEVPEPTRIEVPESPSYDDIPAYSPDYTPSETCDTGSSYESSYDSGSYDSGCDTSTYND